MFKKYGIPAIGLAFTLAAALATGAFPEGGDAQGNTRTAKAHAHKTRAARSHTPSPTPSPTITPTPRPVFPQFKASNSRQGYLGLEVTPPLNLAWKFKAKKAVYSSPAVVEDMVYFGSEDRYAYAVSLAAGKLAWKTRLGERVYSSSPAVFNGMVYIVSVDGCLNCLNKDSGKILWKFCAPPHATTRLAYPAFSSPLVEGGLVYFGADNRNIYAVNAQTGEKSWQFGTEGKIHDNSPCLKDGKLYFASQDGDLYALDAVDGKQLWRYTSPGDQTLNTCPVAWADNVYFGSGDKSLFYTVKEPDGFLVAVSAKDGSLAWQFKTSHGVMSSPAVDAEGRLVFGSADRGIYCLKASSGAKLWSFETGKQVVASPIITGGVAYLGSLDSHLYALGMEKGERLWNFQAEGGIFSSAAACGSRLVVGDLAGNVYCFEGKVKE